MEEIEIRWKENGWTVMQDADEKHHVVEISCFAENGTVTEIRKRHNDGEEEKLTRKIDANHVLPMALEDLKNAFLNGEIEW